MRRTLDVSKLPTYTFGPADPVWWSASLFIAIETTMFALLLTAYFYVRGNFQEWPPTGPGAPSTKAACVGAVLLALSIVPAVLADRAARRHDLRGMRRQLIAATVLMAGFLVARALELAWLAFRWDDHAYGSVFWATVGMHTFHSLTSLVENGVMVAVLSIGPVEKRHLVDVHSTALYWYFVTGAWLPIVALLYGDR
jgi:heme/copper-type cytochrome/quinol oxidase subunit 3